MTDGNAVTKPQRGLLAAIERIGNKLPDPAMLFVALLFIVWILSWLLSYLTFDVVDPRSGEPLVVINQLTGPAFTTFLSGMVNTFVTFGPVGTVLECELCGASVAPADVTARETAPMARGKAKPAGKDTRKRGT